jgi:hypothetical protein
MIDFSADSFIHTVWFVSWDEGEWGSEGDWLAAVFQPADLRREGMWLVAYRFRYYGHDPDEDPFGGTDQKSQPHVLQGPDPDKACAAMDLIGQMTVAEKGGARKADRVVLNCSGVEAVQRLSIYDWFHARDASDIGRAGAIEDADGVGPAMGGDGGN